METTQQTITSLRVKYDPLAEIQRLIRRLTRDKSLRIVTVYNEINIHATESKVAQMFNLDKDHVRRIIAAGGDYWYSKSKDMEDKRLVKIPGRITADQFGCSQRIFDTHVKGKWLEVESETQWFVYVWVDGDLHGVHREDLLSDEDYQAAKAEEYIHYLARKKEENEENNKAA